MMKKYENPAIEMISLSEDDVISTSLTISNTEMYSGFGEGSMEGNGVWTW